MMLVRSLLLGWHLDIILPNSNPLASIDKEYEFSAMIEETSIKSAVIEYYSNKLCSDPVLIGASLTDILDDGISMVYSFYDPEIKQNSFGKYIILDHIEYAKQLGLPYVYLGYWVPNSESCPRTFY